MEKNYYEVLGVVRDADETAIRQAFRQKSRACHPDFFPDDPKKAAQFRELSEAYGILDDAEKRRTYDQKAGVSLRHGALGAVTDFFRKKFRVEGGENA